MAMNADDGTPWGGPGFTFDRPVGNWPTEPNRQPVAASDDMNSAINAALRQADLELLSEDGTGEYILAGGPEETDNEQISRS